MINIIRDILGNTAHVTYIYTRDVSHSVHVTYLGPST